MRRQTVGAAVLSVWTGGNLALAVGILFAMTVMGTHPPSLYLVFDAAEAAQVDPRALALIDALAVLFNACAAALCGLSLAVLRFGPRTGTAWPWWALAVALGGLQAFGFVSDHSLGDVDLVANLVSAGVLAVGLALFRPGGTAS